MKNTLSSVRLTLPFSINEFSQISINGKVTESQKNLPLQGATITFGKGSVTTGKEGGFSIACTGAGSVNWPRYTYYNYGLQRFTTKL